MGAILRIKIMVIFISGVNIRNEYRVNRIAGIAGRASSLSETTRKIYVIERPGAKKQT
jgi:hypothetical protein